jgi:hypothetical protein
MAICLGGIIRPDALFPREVAMYSMLLPLNPNVQRHNAGPAVPPSGTWREVIGNYYRAILHAIGFRHR